jgi:hypothetical protein
VMQTYRFHQKSLIARPYFSMLFIRADSYRRPHQFFRMPSAITISMRLG